MRKIDSVSRAEMLETYADLYEAFDDNPYIRKELDKVYDQLNGLQSVEPERKKGKWTETEKNEYWGMWYRCSECGKTSIRGNFCPKCGADMREDQNGKGKKSN